ncbi:MAG: LamG domain-containing protein [Patescibacteria group bacterium]|nr:MAG: LamG domain-containing protein [Patescibacteria group bacterium]
MSYFAKWKSTSFSTNFPSAVGNNSTGITNRGLSTTWSSGRIALDFWSVRYRATTALSPQTWYHLAFVKNNGTISSTTKLYVNGQEVSGALEGTDSIPDIIDSPLIMGRLDSTRWFNGNISQVQIYNRALSAEEVLQNYNATKARFGL